MKYLYLKSMENYLDNMKKHKIEIKIKNGYGKIIIDGKEMKRVTEYAIYQHTGRLPKVQITFETDELELDIDKSDLELIQKQIRSR